MRGCEALTEAEVVSTAAAMRGQLALRDRAWFILAVTTGLRISEVLSVDIEDVRSPDRTMVSTFLVRRANTKGRIAGKVCPLYPVAAQAISRWLLAARAFYGAQRDWPLFCTTRGKRMHRNHAGRVLARAMRRAGIYHAVMGTHSCRKSFIADNLRRLRARQIGGEQIDPLLELQKLTGHKSLDSLICYVNTMGVAARESSAAGAESLRLAFGRGNGGESPNVRKGLPGGVGEALDGAICRSCAKPGNAVELSGGT